MATASFDRTFVVEDEKSRMRLEKILSSDKPAKPITRPPFTEEERDRSESLLKQCLSHYKA